MKGKLMPAMIEWLDDEFTRARVTTESSASRWWRRRYITSEVARGANEIGRQHWRFEVGGDRVLDHDETLAGQLEHARDREVIARESRAFKAKLKNPWTEVVPLPPAKVVKS